MTAKKQQQLREMNHSTSAGTTIIGPDIASIVLEDSPCRANFMCYLQRGAAGAPEQ